MSGALGLLAGSIWLVMGARSIGMLHQIPSGLVFVQKGYHK